MRARLQRRWFRAPAPDTPAPVEVPLEAIPEPEVIVHVLQAEEQVCSVDLCFHSCSLSPNLR
jgi:hypothetical protein